MSGLVVQASVPPGLVPMARVIEAAELVTVLPAGVLDGHRWLGGPGRAVDPAAGLGGDDELGGGAEGDGEGVAGGPGEAGGGSRSGCSCPPCR